MDRCQKLLSKMRVLYRMKRADPKAALKLARMAKGCSDYWKLDTMYHRIAEKTFGR